MSVQNRLPAGDERDSQSASFVVGGVDTSPLVQFLKLHVYVLNRPVLTYNWSSLTGQNAQDFIFQSSNMAMRVWGEKQNAIRPGLYLAIDPVSSRNFGGENWRLTQVTLPAQFRFFNFVKDQQISYPDDIKKIWQDLGCPIPPDLYSSFSEHHNNSLSCKAAFQKIMQVFVQLDGYTYDYYSSDFSECPSGAAYEEIGSRNDRNLAFVITGNRWLKPAYIKAYSTNSTGDQSDRIRVQTLFYKATQDHNPNESKFKIPEVMSDRGPVITAASKDFSRNLLWADLDGQKPDKSIGSWIKTNLFGCSDNLYSPAK